MTTVLLLLTLLFFVLAAIGTAFPAVFAHRKTGEAPKRSVLLLGNCTLSAACLAAAALLYQPEPALADEIPASTSTSSESAEPSSRPRIDPRLLDPSPEQLWVIENVFIGMPWDEGEWSERFGEPEESPSERSPEIFKNYYFEQLEMTISVNVLKGEVMTWGFDREGL